MTDGYDPDFLARSVPMPQPASLVRALTYPHFSVLLDPERRLAVVTAVNIDGAGLREIPRTGDWRLDPRAAADEQTGPAVYARNSLDRGHLVRRRDPGWGDPDEARVATEATFFYTNAAPQAAEFNQSKQLWLGLEDHVLSYAEGTDQRLSVFTAPVLADDDPPYRGVLIPLRFWKVAVWHGPQGLSAAGFVLDQTDLIDVREGVLAAPPLAEFGTFQVPIDEIARIAGVDFGTLPDADVLRTLGARPGPWRRLNTAEEIVL